MLNFITHIDWKKILFPILYDFESIDAENDITQVRVNNWNAANNDEDYRSIQKEIEITEKVNSVEEK